MSNDDKKTKPKPMTLWDLFESKHGPTALQRMKAKPDLTLGEALEEIREEKGEEAEDVEEEAGSILDLQGGA